MPIDHIISPEKEVSAAVSNQLRVPGAFDVKDMCEGKMNLVGVLLTDDSPIRDVSLRHLTNLFPDLLITVLAIIRDGKVVIPRSGAESMQTGDRVYFVCMGHLHRAMASFGHEESEALLGWDCWRREHQARCGLRSTILRIPQFNISSRVLPCTRPCRGLAKYRHHQW